MGVPPNGWFIEKVILKWMMTSGTPILGNPLITWCYSKILNEPVWYTGVPACQNFMAMVMVKICANWSPLVTRFENFQRSYSLLDSYPKHGIRGDWIYGYYSIWVPNHQYISSFSPWTIISEVCCEVASSYTKSTTIPSSSPHRNAASVVDSCSFGGKQILFLLSFGGWDQVMCLNHANVGIDILASLRIPNLP